MRYFIFILTFLTACTSEPEICVFAVTKDSDEVKYIDPSLSIDQFIDLSESLYCQGFTVFGSSSNSHYSDQLIFRIQDECKFPQQMKIIEYDGIQFPIYECEGFRDYGINLCDDEMNNLEKLKQFYLNPKRLENYPMKLKNATLKIIVDESKTLESIFPIIEQVKALRDQIDSDEFSTLLLLMSIQTIQMDTVLIKGPPIIDISN